VHVKWLVVDQQQSGKPAQDTGVGEEFSERAQIF